MTGPHSPAASITACVFWWRWRQQLRFIGDINQLIQLTVACLADHRAVSVGLYTTAAAARALVRVGALGTWRIPYDRGELSTKRLPHGCVLSEPNVFLQGPWLWPRIHTF